MPFARPPTTAALPASRRASRRTLRPLSLAQSLTVSTWTASDGAIPAHPPPPRAGGTGQLMLVSCPHAPAHAPSTAPCTAPLDPNALASRSVDCCRRPSPVCRGGVDSPSPGRRSGLSSHCCLFSFLKNAYFFVSRQLRLHPPGRPKRTLHSASAADAHGQWNSGRRVCVDVSRRSACPSTVHKARRVCS